MIVESRVYNQLLGESSDDLSASHALRQGSHDALSDLVKYAIMGTIAVIIIPRVVKNKEVKKIIRKVI